MWDRWSNARARPGGDELENCRDTLARLMLAAQRRGVDAAGLMVVQPDQVQVLKAGYPARLLMSALLLMTCWTPLPRTPSASSGIPAPPPRATQRTRTTTTR